MNKKGIIGLVVAIVMVIIAVVSFAIYQNTKIDNTDGNSEDSKNTDTSSNRSKTLVVYYSAQNHTKAVAEKIAKNLNADTFEIEPEEKYTSEDLNWTNNNSRVSREHNDESLRDIKLVKEKVENWEDYDTIFIGYPIWWSDLPQILYTFLESYDFTGKNVYLFSTNGGSVLSGTVSTITNKLSGANVNSNAFKLHRNSMEDAPEEVETWLKEINIIR